MPKLVDSNMCTGCAACADSCNHGALCMQYDKNGFLRPKVDYKLCIGCGSCERACPIMNFGRLPFHDVQDIRHYAAWSDDEQVCRKASSGGIFSQIAINFLQNKDVLVFGAEADKNNTCHHRGVSSIDSLQRISGTKYVQSNAEGSYREVKRALAHGKKVLFCGTPCQIAALYAVLGYKDRENLFTAELICHGVASKVTADVVTAYVGANHVYSYRDKSEGWCKPGLIRVSQKTTFCMPDGTLLRPDKNLFWSCFATTHRISCTHCLFAKLPRLADVSLGDLWGLYKQYPERGILGASLVLTNTPKGEGMLRSGHITSIEHERKSLNCYTLFFPGASRFAQLSKWLFLIRKLKPQTAYNILCIDWRKNIICLPIRLLFRIASKIHLAQTKAAIRNTKNRLGWN